MAKLISLLFIPLFFSFLISYFITPIVIRFAKKLKIMDDPRGKTHPKIIHDKPTPRGGGIPVFIAILIASLVFIPIDKHLIAILIGAFVIFVMGFLDDRYNLNPYLRLAIGMVAALIPILSGIGISFLTNPFGGILDLSNPLISDLFALIWIVFMMNMLNMGAKGIDGQLSGVTVISAILTAVTAGAFLGFFPWHKFPQKIMPGYGGATLAGYMLAIASILSTTKVGTLIVVLGIPLIDTGYSIIRRILSGKSPVWGDRGHLHHKLLDSGLSKKQVSQVYWSLTAILGILALNLNATNKLYTIVGVVFLIGGIIIWLTYRSK
ncbi:MAG: Undecaprenyl-phosphate N-acetylglucosaminyl 1-phosphate transferase [Candidatus Woesebacteria bacterium GW2011_GWE2_31_6]|nr:MAG: Undecaprenyl-phosphate N-acetylglucosaminyl 1-phosphate transferase [Candidatus Woesebacteria bacterium GW2011_GWE2_31_6]